MIPLAPYQIRAVWQWCIDNTYIPHILINTKLSDKCQVPSEYIDNNGMIVFNISSSATNNLNIDNDSISFTATFKGVRRNVYIPIYCLTRIYSKETSLGLELNIDPSEYEKEKPVIYSDNVVDMFAFKSKHKNN